MGKIYDAVYASLTSDSVKFDVETNDDSSVSFTMKFRTKIGNVSVRIWVKDETECYCVAAYLPNNIPVGLVDKIYPLINQINRNSLFTSWNVDPEDGEVVVKCGVTADEGAVSAKQVDVCLYSVLNQMQEKYEEVMTTVYR